MSPSCKPGSSRSSWGARRLIAAALYGLVLVTAAPARAQVASVTPSEATEAKASDAEQRAERHFRAGVVAALEERWGDARRDFEQALALSPRLVVRVNLAGAQVRTGSLVAASHNYSRVLGELSEGDEPETVAAVRRVAAEVRARIPRLTVRVVGGQPSDDVLLDGARLSEAQLTQRILVDPGRHRVALVRGGRELTRLDFTLHERDERAISLVAPGVQPALAAPPTERRRPRTVLGSPWFWGASAAALAGVSTAVVLATRQADPFEGNVPPGRVGVK